MGSTPEAASGTDDPARSGLRGRRLPRQRGAESARHRVVDAPRPRRRFAVVVVVADLVLIAAVVTTCVVFGLTGSPAADRSRIASGLLVAGLLVSGLLLFRAWEGRVLGQGATEFVRLGRGVVTAVVAMALGGLALLIGSTREWVFGLIPLIGAALFVERYALRKVLHHRRARGRGLLPVLAVGSEQAVLDLVRRTRRDPYYGWEVTGVCTPSGQGTDGGTDVGAVPVVGDLDDVPRIARSGRHRVVAVCRAPGWGPQRLHRLAWDLEGMDTELAVDPGLMEIAGPRMHIDPVDGMPLLRLSHPRFTGPSWFLKYSADRLVAAALLLVFLPCLLVVAVAVKLEDRGPVLYRQCRVGAAGRTFRMVKFRTMVPDADGMLAGLLDHSDGAGPLFKMRSDPRVTRVGAFLRTYSLDELPQLVNVLGGSMSLVGPRPPLPAEVDEYAADARRRLLVRPGMTGLWQVSGRSLLTWEESVRLDLRYVENWSPALDLLILWKTFGAVARRRGAF